MARRDSNPLSMTELCEYFKERNGRIFNGEDANNEATIDSKKMSIDKRIKQRNSRPSLRIQLEPKRNDSDPLSGNSVLATPPPFSSSQPRLGRSPLTPRSSSSSSSGCSCCLSPYDSSPMSEKLLRFPLTPQSATNSSGCSCCVSPFVSSPRSERFLCSPSTTTTSGCSCCSSPCYVPSPRPQRSQLSPFGAYVKGYHNNAAGCCCHFFPISKQTSPKPCQDLPQSHPASTHGSYSVPSSPYSPQEVPRSAVSHLALLSNPNMAPHLKATTKGCTCCNPQSPLRLQHQGKRRCSFPVSPRPPNEDQSQPRMVRSLPGSPKTAGANISRGTPHQPLLRRRQQMKNESRLKKATEEEFLNLCLAKNDEDDDDDVTKTAVEFFP